MIRAKVNAKSFGIYAIVTRANGLTENLGLIAYWHRNPLRRWAVNFFIWIKELIK